jgi:ABC-type nitrate/sulfonate/bicarbonate transport system permease component
MKKLIRNTLIVVAIAATWEFISSKSNPLFVPSIKDVIENFITLIGNGMLFKSIWMSFYRITVATVISVVISLPLALLVYSSKLLDKILTPITNMLRYLPVTAFYPLLILWVGINEEMKITFLFCATIFYFLPSIILCIKEVDERLIDTGYTMGMNKYDIITKIVLPYTLPSIYKSILMMYGIGWTYIVVAEMTNATSGLGYLINIGSARGRTDMVFMSIITIMLISCLVDRIGNKYIERKFTWKFNSKKEVE